MSANLATLLTVVIVAAAGLVFSRFVIMPLGEPSSVWLWCDMLRTCAYP